MSLEFLRPHYMILMFKGRMRLDTEEGVYGEGIICRQSL